MSDNQKIYVDSFKIKSRKTNFGEVLALGIKADAFIEFINKYKNEAGYLNVDILPRKEVGKFGETHYSVLNTWSKDKANNGTAPQQSAPQAKVKAPARKAAAPAAAAPDQTDF